MHSDRALWKLYVLIVIFKNKLFWDIRSDPHRNLYISVKTTCLLITLDSVGHLPRLPYITKPDLILFLKVLEGECFDMLCFEYILADIGASVIREVFHGVVLMRYV